jgi:hypothetical protein
MIDVADIERARDVPIQSLVRGLRRSGADLVGPCPCPGCGGGDRADRFAVHVATQKFNCRQCGVKGKGAIDFIMRCEGVEFPRAIEILIGRYGSAAKPIVSERNNLNVRNSGNDDHERRQAEKAAHLWRQSQRGVDSIVEDYLASRGIRLKRWPPTIRYLPARDDHPPCMISAYGLVPEIEPGILGEPINVSAVHLTKLKPDGSGKADVERPKITIGRPLARAIAVSAPADGHASLVITEGTEDALTAHLATGQACWAAGSASYMPALADSIPNYFECVTIVAHPDAAGQRDARKLADMLSGLGFPEIRTVDLD